MTFKCCEYVSDQIVLSIDNISLCCLNSNLTILNDYNGGLIDIKDYIEKKEQFINLFKSNQIIEGCEGCIHLKDYDDDYNPKNLLRRILVSHRSKCSCNCIYCSSFKNDQELRKKLNSRIPYDIKDVLFQLRDANLIDNNARVVIIGGECGEYPKEELEWLLQFVKALNCKIELFSSGIFYSEIIEKNLSNERIILNISPDAGRKQTYEKIKRVKTFDRVWKNIKKYVKASKNNPNAFVEIKYVIVPGINDNIDEAYAFIKKCISADVKSIVIGFEYQWMSANKDKPLSSDLKRTLKYFNYFSKLLNIRYEM